MLDGGDGDGEAAFVGLAPLNSARSPMSTASRASRRASSARPGRTEELVKKTGFLTADDARQLKALVTFTPDAMDWEDEVRLAVEERSSLSPDALTGMEANLRFAGPETLETKIFARLSAWQNWIFQRPNAVGERGALTMYGRPERPEFDWRRT